MSERQSDEYFTSDELHKKYGKAKSPSTRELIAKVVNIMQTAAASPGQFILTVERMKITEAQEGYFGSASAEYVAAHRLGILDGTALVHRNLYFLKFGTRGNTVFTYGLSGRSISFGDVGSLIIPCTSLSSLTNLLLTNLLETGELNDFGMMQRPLEIVIGDNAVEEWFKAMEAEDCFQKLCEKLGRPNRAMRDAEILKRIKERGELEEALSLVAGEVRTAVQRADNLGIGYVQIVAVWKEILDKYFPEKK